MSRILIAEDEQRIASFLEKGLRANGFTTTIASTGRRLCGSRSAATSICSFSTSASPGSTASTCSAASARSDGGCPS
jgi:DNA-binding NtrC family response regulator